MKIYRYLTASVLVSLLGAPSAIGDGLAPISDGAICSNAVRNGQWETTGEKIKYVEEARARNLNCGIKAKASKVEYSNGYAQASLRCGKAPNGKRGWSATLDGYANPHGFVLYRNYISAKGEIGYTFLEARRNKGFGAKGGFLITGMGVRESGNSWNFKFNIPPDTDLLEAFKTGIEGFENPSSSNWKRKCTLKAYSLYRPVNPEMVNSLRENITELRAKAQNEREKAQILEAKNNSIATELSARATELVKLNTLVDAQESEFNEYKQIHEALIEKNEKLLAQLNQAKQAAEKITAGTKKEKDLELKIADLNSQQKKLAGNLAKAQKELAETTKEKESLSQSVEDLKKAHQQEIASLKKLIPDATLENQKLAKIASDASGKAVAGAGSTAPRTSKIQMTLEASILGKSKEFGDGFTNYVAPLNQNLVAIEIYNAKFLEGSDRDPSQLEYVLFDEGKPVIPQSREALEAAIAQEFKKSQPQALLMVYEIPMNAKLESLKVLVLSGSTIIGETKLKNK